MDPQPPAPVTQPPSPPPVSPRPRDSYDSSSIYPTQTNAQTAHSPTAIPAEPIATDEKPAGSGVALGLALIAVFGLPVVGTQLFITLFSPFSGQLTVLYRLTQVDGFIYLFAVIGMLMLSRMGRTMVIVAAAGVILLQGYSIHKIMAIRKLEPTASVSSSLNDSFNQTYVDSGIIIFVQIATIAYLVRSSVGDYFD